jgi:hypothetical protein
MAFIIQFILFKPKTAGITKWTKLFCCSDTHPLPPERERKRERERLEVSVLPEMSHV